MRRMIIEQDIRPMSEFRSGVASFIKQVHETKRPLVITQHGKGVGVLLDVGEFEAMQEKIELLEVKGSEPFFVGNLYSRGKEVKGSEPFFIDNLYSRGKNRLPVFAKIELVID